MNKGWRLYERAKKIIPGGTQLFSKRPEIFLPELWPCYYTQAKGVKVKAIDGKTYIDMSHNGVGTYILGVADPEIDSEVIKAIKKGTMSTLNCPEEVKLAELLIELHPWAEMVRFARTGGEAMAVAVRIARAATGREKIVFCGYHGWHDWYLSANLTDERNLNNLLLPGLEPNGVPVSLKGTSIPFEYNRTDQLDKIIEKNGNEIAAIVMEPVRSTQPQQGFLEHVRKVSKKINCVLVFDEITAGWRMNVGGIHLIYNIIPDMAVLGKAMGNGYPMAAIIGKKEVMEAAQKTFISSSYWTERIGPVAALATIRKIQREKVPDYLIKIGNEFRRILNETATKYGLNIKISGIPPLTGFSFDYENSQAISTLFTQEMLKNGFLAGKSFYATFSHKMEHLKKYQNALDKVFKKISEAINNGTVEKKLRCPIAHSTFKRLA